MRKIFSGLPKIVPAGITAFFLLAAYAQCSQLGHGEDNLTPQPVLVSPTSETVDLAGKNELVFKWSPHEGHRGMRECYDFRLYRGYAAAEPFVIYKEKVDPHTYQITVKTDLFNDGQIYTWTLRQVYDAMHKSDRSRASFKVIKK